MRGRAWRYVTYGLLIVAVFITVKLPSEVILNQACEPRGWMNHVRAAVWNTQFWSSQRDLMRKEVQQIEAMPAQWALLDAQSARMRAETNRSLDSLYAAIPELPRRRPATAAQALRGAADELEAAEIRQTLLVVMGERRRDLIACYEYVDKLAG